MKVGVGAKHNLQETLKQHHENKSTQLPSPAEKKQRKNLTVILLRTSLLVFTVLLDMDVETKHAVFAGRRRYRTIVS